MSSDYFSICQVEEMRVQWRKFLLFRQGHKTIFVERLENQRLSVRSGNVAKFPTAFYVVSTQSTFKVECFVDFP